MSDSGWCLTGELQMEQAAKLEAELETLCDELGMFPPTLSRFEQAGSPLWQVDIYFSEEPEPAFLKELLDRANTVDWVYKKSRLENRDWVSESQKLLAPVRAGRFLVFGSHDVDKSDPELTNIQIDAGQAFGTGKHETTAACLKILDAIADTISPASFLDLGTGSGVLALAAAKIWPDIPGTATDIDPIATKVATENAHLNIVSTRKSSPQASGVLFITADGLDDPHLAREKPYDLIFANILAGPLITMAPDIVAGLSKTGALILSGLLIEQKMEVLSAYALQGLSLVDSEESGDWAALLLRRQ